MKIRKPKVKTFLSMKTTVLVYRVFIVVGLVGTIYSSNIIRLPDTNKGINLTNLINLIFFFPDFLDYVSESAMAFEFQTSL